MYVNLAQDIRNHDVANSLRRKGSIRQRCQGAGTFAVLPQFFGGQHPKSCARDPCCMCEVALEDHIMNPATRISPLRFLRCNMFYRRTKETLLVGGGGGGRWMFGGVARAIKAARWNRNCAKIGWCQFDVHPQWHWRVMPCCVNCQWQGCSRFSTRAGLSLRDAR